MAGGDGPIRSYIVAFDAKTGKEVWRFYTIPGPGEPGHETWSGDSWKTGGAAIWNIGAYDPDTNLTFWGTGNPAPDTNGDVRLGDNLYSDCVVALDADTGKLKWYYQFTPHDTMDYDSTQVPVLADIEFQGQPAQGHAVGQPQRSVLRAGPHHRRIPAGQAFRQGELADRLRRKGPAHARAGQQDSADAGAGAAATGSAGPTGIRLRTARTPVCSTFPAGKTAAPWWRRTTASAAPPATRPWRRPILFPNHKTEAEGYGIVRAFDPKTGEKKWEYKMNDITWAGVLSTASDLVFSGGREGYFYALDGKNGNLLWKENRWAAR